MIGAFISAFCVGCILLGALYVLAPKGNLSKAASYAFSLAFLCLVLSVTGKLQSVDFPKLKEANEDYSNERLSAACAQMIFSDALASQKINFSKITVFTDKSQSGGISITKVLVYTDASYEQVNAVIGSDIYEVVVVNG